MCMHIQISMYVYALTSCDFLTSFYNFCYFLFNALNMCVFRLLAMSTEYFKPCLIYKFTFAIR